MFTRAKIASLVTVLALGGLAAVALASGSGGDPAAVQTQDDVAAKPKVRTVIVRQTVHRRAKAKSSPSASSSAGASSSPSGYRSSGSGSGSAPAPAVVTQVPAVTDDHRGRGGDDDSYDDHGDDAYDDHGDDAFDDHGGDDDSGRGRGRGGDDD